MDILRIQDLKVYFRASGRLVKAVDGVDMILPKGVTTALAGESGCGKTTLARAILGFNQPLSGKIFFNDRNIILKENQRLLRRGIQIVFQNPLLSLDSRYTVFDTLNEAVQVFEKVVSEQAYERIVQALREVEIDPDILERFLHQLSGGQRQRVCIARSIINKPPLVILDEPTSSLDVTTAAKIIALLAGLQVKHGLTFLFISHDLRLLKKVAQFWYIMYYGKIVEYGPAKEVYNNPAHPYTQLLKQAGNYALKNIPDQKEIPDQGCPFAERCPRVKPECRQGALKREVSPGHFVYCN